jgi:hypothetical protein
MNYLHNWIYCHDRKVFYMLLTLLTLYRVPIQ